MAPLSDGSPPSLLIDIPRAAQATSNIVDGRPPINIVDGRPASIVDGGLRNIFDGINNTREGAAVVLAVACASCLARLGNAGLLVKIRAFSSIDSEQRAQRLLSSCTYENQGQKGHTLR